MLSFTGCAVILFGLVGPYGYNNAVRNFYEMEIRKYKQSDCKKLAKPFYHTVHTVNAKDYTEGQLNVWADGKVDLEKWNISLQEHFSIVAIDDDVIVAFGDIDKTGYSTAYMFIRIIRERELPLLYAISWRQRFRGALLRMLPLRQALFCE